MALERTDLSIVHPWDPWDQGIGGFESCLDGFLRYAPAAWTVELVGLTRDPAARPVGSWLDRSFADRSVKFLAVLEDTEPDLVRRIPLSLRFAIACRRYHVRPAGDIVQFHRFESALGMAIPSRTRRVLFIHNHPPEIRSSYSDVRWHALYRLHDLLLLQQVRRASGVVSVDPRTPAWLAGHLPALRPHLLFQNQWADPALFHNTASEERRRDRVDLRSTFGAGPDAEVMMFAGRLERQKDPMLLLEAFARLKQSRPRVFLAVVGKGRLGDQMASSARVLGLSEDIRFLGAVPREEMPHLYRAADVLICTSGFEAGPRTVFESLACGTPAVSLDVGQARELLVGRSDIGRLVEQRTPEELAHALSSVLAGDLSIAQQARCEAAVAAFTPQNGLAAVFELYEHWLEGERRTRL